MKTIYETDEFDATWKSGVRVATSANGNKIFISFSTPGTHVKKPYEFTLSESDAEEIVDALQAEIGEAEETNE